MKNSLELNYKDLKDICNPNIFHFDTTADIKEYNTIYGQDRGINALQFGVQVEVKGYNIFVEGPTGVGKTMYTKNYLETISKKKKTPNDWCYIYNFDDPNEPIAISFPAGQGKLFKKTMDDFIKDVRLDIKRTFDNEDFEKEKQLIRQEFESKRDLLLEKLNEKSIKHGFQVKTAQNGIYMMPVLNGKTIEEEEFNNLDESIRKEFEDKSNIVQQQIYEAINEIKAIEKEADKKIDEWQSNIALLTINLHINTVKNIFKRNKKINKFLENIKKDILKNISYFTQDDAGEKNTRNINMSKTENKAPWNNYKVNLFIDNSNLEGAPVIMDTNYSYNNIFGKLEYENQFGALKTDYTMLKPGLLHKANGGYIIFQAKDLIANPGCYEALKKALSVKLLNIENSVDQRSSMVLVSLKPEAIPLNVKVILIGNANMYYTLLSLDEDFSKLFKVKVEFEEDAPKTDENIQKLSQFIGNYCKNTEILDLDREAMAKIVEFASRLADDKDKISTKFNEISQIVAESSTWAKMAKKKIITKEFIQKALDQRVERIKKYDSRYLEMIKENTLLISTDGYEVGQINGLTIITIGDYSFGKPSKITANTYLGKSGITNIEREIEISGPSHSKGVLILTGYLGEKFAQDFPLSLTASLCFEQLYNGVDGDSASSTEAYALLSSLSGIPINQSLAVTGSVNQKGEIQPIGGVNEKIEGFYQICKMRGFNKKHGVIIPIQNVRNLHLSDEIIESVKNGDFHIYAINTIDEGIELLTGVPAGKKNKDGTFPAGSINYLVYEKLKSYAEKSKIFE